MKFGEIFRFEFGYQLHRIRTWLYFVILFVVAFLLTNNLIEDARNGGAFANSPSAVAFITALCNVLWVLLATAVAGTSAARDAQTRIHPLVYTSPISKTDYLGGRFLAALALNAVILLMVPAGMLFAVLKPGVEPGVLGPFRPLTYISCYVFIGLSTAIVATAIQFSLATLKRRAVTSYLGSIMLFFFSFASGAAANFLHQPTLGKLLDPIHYISNGLIANALTPLEKNTRLVALEPMILLSDLLWVSIAVGVLLFTRLRFRFVHHASSGSDRGAGHNKVIDNSHSYTPVSAPASHRAFGVSTSMRQAFSIASASFETIIKGPAGLMLIAPIAILLGAVVIPLVMDIVGVPLIPTTAQVITMITSPIANSLRFPWVIIPMLIIFYTGELVWRERDARLNDIADTTPVPEWVSLLGKFMGLGLVLFTWMIFLVATGMMSQMRMGYFHVEPGVYVKAMFGIQLIDWLLFAALAFAIHIIVNQKQLGYLVALMVYGFIALASKLGIEHNLLVYTAAPGWRYSDMRAFGSTVGPWLWFKAYWFAWTLLLALAVKLLWVRGRERGGLARLREVRRRFTRSTAVVTMIAILLIVSIGGYIFYNTNVLNTYETATDQMNHKAEYERRYGKYKSIAQPSQIRTTLHVDVYPDQREAKITGTYVLVNKNPVEIDSIHVATTQGAEVRVMSIDQSAVAVLTDDDFGYRIYALEKPLQPGDSLQLTFEVDIASHGFGNNGSDALVFANGTYLANQDCLPAIGYQRDRELTVATERKRYGLPAQPLAPSLDDSIARRVRVGGDPIMFEAIVSTSADQIAVAPGVLSRTWTAGDRKYFHYISDAPINNAYSIFSARYALHEEKWIPSTSSGTTPSTGLGSAVTIQIFHEPGHEQNLASMVRAVRASLGYHTAKFGPYPHNYIRLIEHAALGIGVHSQAATIEYGERFAAMNADGGPRDLYIVFSVLAHAAAREWWGMQVVSADVEGAGLLTVSLETYSAMRIVEDTLGTEVLQRYLGSLREAFSTPRSRAALPLIRATESFAFSRKGPFALYAMREYMGKERVDDALHSLYEKRRSATSPLATSLDLYRELETVTPDSLHYLLKDLFEKNTFWDFDVEQTIAHRTEAGSWQVSLEINARKVVVDEAGIETEAAMNDWIEIGVFGGNESYIKKQLVKSGRQTITVTVPMRPDRAGIDPRHLLSDLGEVDVNVKSVKIVD